MARILIWDIESTDLQADFGITLCVGYKWYGQDETKVISILDHKGWKKEPWNDSRVWVDFLKVFNQADMHVTYFGTGFDRPMMYAKLMKHGLEIPANIPQVDLFYTVKSNFKLSRKSLDNVSKYLGLKAQKTPVSGETWLKASMGHKESIQYVVDHCIADIDLTEELYTRLKPLIRTHPRVAGLGPCRACGSTKLQRRGMAVTTLQKPRQRIQCQDCGSWDLRVPGEMLPTEKDALAWPQFTAGSGFGGSIG